MSLPWSRPHAATCLCGSPLSRRWHGLLTHGSSGRARHRRWQERAVQGERTLPLAEGGRLTMQPRWQSGGRWR